jgi:hypothetical protein
MLYAVDTPFNMTYYFDDAVALGGPALIAPADGTRVDIASALTATPQAVNFTWNRISKATAYELWLALDADFNSRVNIDEASGDNDMALDVSSSVDPTATIVAGSNFQPGQTYYWKVRATTPTSSDFSETRSLIIQPVAATVPNIAAPEVGGSIVSTSPAFSWTPVSGATMYQFQLSTDPAFGTTMVDEQVATAGIAPAVTLDRGTTYFWRVKAIAPVEGDWSTVANFMVAEEAPAPAPPVVIEQTPAPVINIPEPPPATVVEIPPAPAPEQIAPGYIWAIIIIGAVLVIAVIVLIVRTRRQV